MFEDSPKGTESAFYAGMKCIALTTMHKKEEFDDVNILKFISSYSHDLFQSLTSKVNQEA